MLRPQRLEMIRDTIKIIEQGYYEINGDRIPLKLTPEQMLENTVYLPDDLMKIREMPLNGKVNSDSSFRIGVKNMDAFALARTLVKERKTAEKDEENILVLNLANAFYPGGGVLRGARAQEEDLCRVSSLYRSLTADSALSYYRYHHEMRSDLASDAIVITPRVEIFKDENGALLADSVVVSVMTCAAPNMGRFSGEISFEEYESLLYRRVEGMLILATHLGYRTLILGAFGCGAFENDAHVVSDVFYRALQELDRNGQHEKDLFDRIEFAVLAPSDDSYNFAEFNRNFGSYQCGKR